MTFLTTLLSFILVIGVLTLAHEFGHFLIAKRSGMRVDEFAIGMGPRLGSFRRGGTCYRINMFPVGGYVKIAGMEGDGDEDPDGFNAKPLSRRIGVVAAGSIVNVILAALIFISLGMIRGKVVGDTRTIERVQAGSPAASAGIRTGDTVIAVDGRSVPETSELREYIIDHPGVAITLKLQRGGDELTAVVVPQSVTSAEEKDGKIVEREIGRIGVVFKQIMEPMGFLESLWTGIQNTVDLTLVILSSLFGLFTGRVPVDSLSGPVGIARVVGDAARVGWDSLLLWIGILSANVGIFNLLPFPALDGGRLIFLLVEGIRGGRRIDARKEGMVHLIGLVLLLLVIAAVTVKELLQ